MNLEVVNIKLLVAVQCLDYIAQQKYINKNNNQDVFHKDVVTNSEFYYEIVNEVMLKLVREKWLRQNSDGRYDIIVTLSHKNLFDLKCLFISTQNYWLRKKCGETVGHLIGLLEDYNDKFLSSISITEVIKNETSFVEDP